MSNIHTFGPRIPQMPRSPWRQIQEDPPPSDMPLLFGQVRDANTTPGDGQPGQKLFAIDIGIVAGGVLQLMGGATPEPTHWCPLPPPPTLEAEPSSIIIPS